MERRAGADGRVQAFRKQSPIFNQKIYLSSCSQGALELHQLIASLRGYGNLWRTWVEERPPRLADCAIEALRTAALERSIDPGTLALAWDLSNPQIIAVLIGPRRVEHFDAWPIAADLRLSGAGAE